MLSIPKYPEQYAQHFPAIFYLLCCASQHHVGSLVVVGRRGETGRAPGLRLVRGGVEGPGGLGGEPREAPGGWARAPEGGRSLRGGGGGCSLPGGRRGPLLSEGGGRACIARCRAMSIHGRAVWDYGGLRGGGLAVVVYSSLVGGGVAGGSFVRLGMVWYGMVWYGMVWYGMVWYVWYGMVWYGMVWYGMVWYGMVWYGMVWYGMVVVVVVVVVVRAPSTCRREKLPDTLSLGRAQGSSRRASRWPGVCRRRPRGGGRRGVEGGGARVEEGGATCGSYPRALPRHVGRE